LSPQSFDLLKTSLSAEKVFQNNELKTLFPEDGTLIPGQKRVKQNPHNSRKCTDGRSPARKLPAELPLH
jgi:hypothetical protein